MTTISKYVSYAEATATHTGLDNTPSADQLEAMRSVAQNVFDRAREHFNGPLGINSFFRSQAVNKAVGGAASSQHTQGEAIDIDAKKYGTTTNAKLFHYIKDNLTFDQIIWEFGTSTEPSWVHVSFERNGQNRKQALRAVKVNGKTTYQPFS